MAVSGMARAGMVALALGALAAAARAQSAPSHDKDHDKDKATQVAPVRIRQHSEDTRPKLEHMQREVDGAKITVTRKSSVALLDQQPTVVGDAPRELFARTPGVVADDQPNPTRAGVAYRGLGAEPGGESVLVLRDGLPISTDLIGAPALAFLPFSQGVAQAQLLRGGSSLVYGPETAAINLVSRRPKAGEAMTGYSEQVGGSDGLYSTYDTIEGSRGRFDYRADLGVVRSDGERTNAASIAEQADAYVGFHPAKGQLWYVDLSAFAADAGDPGPVGAAEFRADPRFASTPENHDWASRYSAMLGAELDFDGGWRLEGKLRGAYQDLYRRAAEAELPGGPAPLAATLQDEVYRSIDLDLRLKKGWGRGDAFTLGVEAFHDDAPLRQWTGASPDAGLGDRAGAVPALRLSRTSDYEAVFAENVFRLPWKVHVVPSVRIEHEGIDVDETFRPAGLTRPLIATAARRDTPLFGLGVGNDFGKDNETYLSVTQGWRPLRFFDLASPFTNAQPGAAADASRALAWEGGVHGTPVKGLFYDASLFWIEVKNRVETQALNILDTVNVNTGDTRNRGFEGEVVYDFLAGRPDHTHLSAFADLTLLDARFVRSDLAGQVGKVPAYAPHALAKAGVTWRRDGAWSLSLTGLSVGSQFFQDSDLAAGAGPTLTPARIPAYVVFDLTGDWRISRRLKLLAGLRNLGDEHYWSSALQTGVNPAPGRTAYAGLALGF